MEALQQRFSRALAWGQNVSYGGEGRGVIAHKLCWRQVKQFS
jgi:hypothetical protein